MIDLILYNGNIVTLDNRQPCVSALAISAGRIVAYGSDDDVLSLASADTVRENLGGKHVIPGLTDAHLHWEWTSHALSQVDLFDVPSKAMTLERIAERVATTPPGEWVLARGWAQDSWEDDKSFPTAADLDKIAPEHPVFAIARSGHGAWINTAAMRLCEVNANTPDPEGGQVVRDADGQPTGILFETAVELIRPHIPKITAEQLAKPMKKAQELALSSGITGIHDFDGPNCLSALQILRERGELALRVVKNINQEWIPHLYELGLRWGFGDDWIRIGGLKLFADGALGTHTAYMVEAYEGEPDNYGFPVLGKEELTELVSKASAAGIPSAVHAIGDRAVHDVLDVYEVVRREEAARGETYNQRRHRIEHLQIIHPDDSHRLAELGIIASMQPIHATSDYEMADSYWGKRNKWAYNPRLQLDQNVVVAFGSDAPVEPLEPLKGIHASVTRRRADGSPGAEGWHPEARLTVDEALRGFTVGPAYAAGMEDHSGKLAPGYFADLVVLDRDLYSIPDMEIIDAKVLATMVGGIWRFGEQSI